MCVFAHQSHCQLSAIWPFSSPKFEEVRRHGPEPTFVFIYYIIQIVYTPSSCFGFKFEMTKYLLPPWYVFKVMLTLYKEKKKLKNKKNKKAFWNPISQRPGSVYCHKQHWPILLMATASNKHSLILSQQPGWPTVCKITSLFSRSDCVWWENPVWLQ